MLLRALVPLILLATPVFGQQAIELSLSANGQTELTWYRGGPLLLEASAFLAEGDQGTLEWPAPLRLTVLNAAGEAQTWPFENLAATSGPVVLTENQAAFNVWGLSAGEFLL